MIANFCFYTFISLLGAIFILVLVVLTNFPSLQQRFDSTGNWFCGNEENEKLSSISADKRCPAAKENLNRCCVYHDNCYHNQLGRHFCDLQFCQCLLSNLIDSNSSKVSNCVTTAKVYCNFVTSMGVFPYKASAWSDEMEDSNSYHTIQKLSMLSSFKDFLKSIFSNI
uniref:Phospholipase A2 domain-containing protein n=1 Tax=Parastrongyloides trichosuri TaxID=131310 RepID=A0A0N4Z7C2_PARTI